jgi:hypothetical protein
MNCRACIDQPAIETSTRPSEVSSLCEECQPDWGSGRRHINFPFSTAYVRSQGKLCPACCGSNVGGGHFASCHYRMQGTVDPRKHGGNAHDLLLLEAAGA